MRPKRCLCDFWAWPTDMTSGTWDNPQLQVIRSLRKPRAFRPFHFVDSKMSVQVTHSTCRTKVDLQAEPKRPGAESLIVSKKKASRNAGSNTGWQTPSVGVQRAGNPRKTLPSSRVLPQGGLNHPPWMDDWDNVYPLRWRTHILGWSAACQDNIQIEGGLDPYLPPRVKPLSMASALVNIVGRRCSSLRPAEVGPSGANRLCCLLELGGYCSHL